MRHEADSATDGKAHVVSDLNKRATELKRAGNMAGAVAVLRQVRALLPHSFSTVDAEAWLRLPLFLQQAGQFDEAAREFDWLLSVVDAWVASDHPDAEPAVREGFAHAHRATIYDKMRVAYKRQGKVQEAGSYGDLAQKHSDAHAQWLDEQRKLAKRGN